MPHKLVPCWPGYYAKSILMTILNGDMTATLPHVIFYVCRVWNPAFLESLTANLRLTSAYSLFHGRIALWKTFAEISRHISRWHIWLWLQEDRLCWHHKVSTKYPLKLFPSKESNKSGHSSMSTPQVFTIWTSIKHSFKILKLHNSWEAFKRRHDQVESVC